GDVGAGLGQEPRDRLADPGAGADDDRHARIEPEQAVAQPRTPLSVISRPLSMIAKASASSVSVMQSGGLVENVLHRTSVEKPCSRKKRPRAAISSDVPL